MRSSDSHRGVISVQKTLTLAVFIRRKSWNAKKIPMLAMKFIIWNKIKLTDLWPPVGLLSQTTLPQRRHWLSFSETVLFVDATPRCIALLNIWPAEKVHIKFLCLVLGGKQSASVLTSNRRRPHQTSTSNVRFGCREAELSWYGSVGLRGVKHGRTEIRCWGVVHLAEEEEEEWFLEDLEHESDKWLVSHTVVAHTLTLTSIIQIQILIFIF